MTSADIRRQFIEFFVQKHGHTFVPSSPVVPHDDPTLLFTNAGMNQFKPYFLGVEKAPYPRAANTQKCIRAGGKHNDLDDVGRSRRHHTFFEMLGNWSFGDYFKQGAIEMSWELLTKVWGLDPTRLHVSCFEGSPGVPRDVEAAEIWKKVANWEQYGLKSEDHIHFFGKDNFWEMGDTGPCGPCTEIYYDRTPDKSGGPQVNGEDPRVMEIWNNVFIQYNRDASGTLTTLPSQHVDTGMGLERICQVLQEKTDNYGTDLFTPLFEALTKLTGNKYQGKFPATNAADPVAEAADAQLRSDIAFRVIADHLRCLTFALTDGAVPSNEGRGYVLRRILRRAVRFGRQQLGLKEPFLHTLVPVVVETMGEMFPELKGNPGRVMELIKEEEVSFGNTLDRGIALFNIAAIDAIESEMVRSTQGQALQVAAGAGPSFTLSATGDRNYSGKKVISLQNENGNFLRIEISLDNPDFASLVRQYCKTAPVIGATDAFKLYDTFGFPIDLTRIMAEERGMTVDLVGYEKLMEEAKERSRGAGKEGQSAVFDLPPDALGKLAALHVHQTNDSFKYDHKPLRATVVAVWTGKDFEQAADSSLTRPGEQVALILDKTSFYAEMGGQIGDAGEISNDHGAVFLVDDTRAVGGFTLHIGHVKTGRFAVDESVTATVLDRRVRIEKNHTSTHLANWALRETLGDHVQQKGSLVDADKLRFDFVHQKAMTDEEIGNVEILVGEKIAKALPVYAEEAPQEKALKIFGLRAVFGEKYPPMVRVVSIGAPVSELLADPTNPKWRAYSVEFCGGTHISNSSVAGSFVITGEESVSKGVRRLVALTGDLAKEAQTQASVIESLISQGEQAGDAGPVVAALQKAIAGGNVPLRARRKAQGAIAELQSRAKKAAKTSGPGENAVDLEGILAAAHDLGGVKLIIAELPEASADVLRNTWDWLKKKHPQQNVAALLASSFTDTDKDGNKLPAKVNLLAAAGDPVAAKLKAGDWIKMVAPIVGGSGGGRPQMAMAGGEDVTKISDALAAATMFATEKLG